MLHRLTLVREQIRTDDMARHGLMMAGFGFALGLFNYLYQLAMGRMLQPDDYGILLSLTSLFMIVSVLALTIRTAMTKFVSRYHAEGNMASVGHLWRLYLKWTLIVGALAFLVVAVLSPKIAWFLRIADYWYVVVLFSALILAFAVPLNYGTLNGLHRFLPLGWTTTLWALLKLALAILLIKLGAGVYGGLAPFFIAFVIVFAITYYLLKDLPQKGTDKLKVTGLRSYMGLSLIAIMSYTVVTNIDVVLVKHFLDENQAGNYAAVAALGRAALFAPMGIALAMFPKTSGLYESGKSHRPVLLKAVVLTALLTGAVVLLYWACPNFFVDLLGGTGKYTLAAPHLFKYSLAMMFFAVSYILMNYFLSLNRVQVAYIFAAVAFLQVLLILYFHSEIAQVVNVMLISGAACLFATLLFYQWWQRPRRLKPHEGDGSY
jgi:O-antigen/teichoic acid export membrane protein